MNDSLKDKIGRPLGQIPSGTFVLTACDGDRCTGMLASWVQQAAFEPPCVTVAIKRGRPVEALIQSSGHFVLNAVGADHTPMFRHFAKGFELDASAFEGLATRREDAGIVLEGCAGHLACRVTGSIDAGDHRVYIGEVFNGMSHGDGKPYVHLRNNGFKY